jgi:hypothetical protein
MSVYRITLTENGVFHFLNRDDAFRSIKITWGEVGGAYWMVTPTGWDIHHKGQVVGKVEAVEMAVFDRPTHL